MRKYYRSFQGDFYLSGQEKTERFLKRKMIKRRLLPLLHLLKRDPDDEVNLEGETKTYAEVGGSNASPDI